MFNGLSIILLLLIFSFSLIAFLTQASSIVVTLVTFSLYPLIEEKPLSSSKVFTGLALFNQLTVPLYIIPMVIPILIASIVSTKRLVRFLGMPEVDDQIVPWRREQINEQKQNLFNESINHKKNGNIYVCKIIFNFSFNSYFLFLIFSFQTEPMFSIASHQKTIIIMLTIKLC